MTGALKLFGPLYLVIPGIIAYVLFAAKVGLVSGFLIIANGYFVPPFDQLVASLHDFHFQGIVFAYLVIMMLMIGEVKSFKKEYTPMLRFRGNPKRNPAGKRGSDC